MPARRTSLARGRSRRTAAAGRAGRPADGRAGRPADGRAGRSAPPRATPARVGAKATDGLKRAAQPMPAFVRAALTDQGLGAAYRQRPPYQQNDYLGWINQAKLPTTKKKRLDQMLRELKGGDRYMNMVWRPTRRPA